MKDPAIAGLITLKNGGKIQTEAGTSIVEVSSTGVASLVADVQATAGSIGSAELAADAVTGAKLADDAVSLEHLDAGITPSHIVVFAGEFTTAGGDANETITVTGALATDLVHATLHTVGGTPRTILTAQANTDAVDVVMSGDPSTDHVLTYTVLRAVA